MHFCYGYRYYASSHVDGTNQTQRNQPERESENIGQAAIFLRSIVHKQLIPSRGVVARPEWSMLFFLAAQATQPRLCSSHWYGAVLCPRARTPERIIKTSVGKQ